MRYGIEYKIKELKRYEDIDILKIIELCKYIREEYNQLNDNTNLQIFDYCRIELENDINSLSDFSMEYQNKRGFKNWFIRSMDTILNKPIEFNRGYRKYVSTSIRSKREVIFQTFYYSIGDTEHISIDCGYDNVIDTLFVKES